MGKAESTHGEELINEKRRATDWREITGSLRRIRGKYQYSVASGISNKYGRVDQRYHFYANGRRYATATLVLAA